MSTEQALDPANYLHLADRDGRVLPGLSEGVNREADTIVVGSRQQSGQIIFKSRRSDVIETAC